jgi:hypothetical protein
MRELVSSPGSGPLPYKISRFLRGSHLKVTTVSSIMLDMWTHILYCSSRR